ncbi:MAG: class I SAM-dependent methyltransferase [Solirubrobacterales bacterium]|nr:class I SAM-dependent methyltransferase [Solirubrobacterales bacterium]
MGLRRSVERLRRAARGGPADGGSITSPDPEPATFDPWLAGFHDETLTGLDRACAGAGTEALPLFRKLDDDLWAVLLSRNYSRYPNIRALMPDSPAPELQLRWNGAAGLDLLNQSRSFYGRVKREVGRHAATGLPAAKLLDFGCGWGRLTRFFSRDVAPGALFGCDPVEEILDVCRESRVPATLARSQFLPESLPFAERFDLVFSFSVFTHISESAARTCLEAIHDGMNPGGLLLLTIRPPAYLDLCAAMHPVREELGPEYLSRMSEPHYLFVPHPAEPDHPQFDGTEMTYGESVVTIPYVRENWSDLFELVDVSLLTADLYQVVLTLKRRD